jgi:hypothetical protein
MRKVSEEWKDGNGFEEEKIDVLMFGDCVFNFNRHHLSRVYDAARFLVKVIDGFVHVSRWNRSLILTLN